MVAFDHTFRKKDRIDTKRCEGFKSSPLGVGRGHLGIVSTNIPNKRHKKANPTERLATDRDYSHKRVTKGACECIPIGEVSWETTLSCAIPSGNRLYVWGRGGHEGPVVESLVLCRDNPACSLLRGRNRTCACSLQRFSSVVPHSLLRLNQTTETKANGRLNCPRERRQESSPDCDYGRYRSQEGGRGR